MKKLFLIFAFIGLIFKGTIAITPPDEGMWLLMYLGKNHDDMKKLGLKLTAEQLYSINNSSLKDAIVGLGNTGMAPEGYFCSGEIVSDKGLVLTNHHCGYDAIQTYSTVEHDYLKDGFWAKNLSEEIPVKDMTMSYLVRMDDVTKEVLADVTDDMTPEARNMTINRAKEKIVKEASEKGKYDVTVKSMFDNNEFYLFVYETYTDIRLVGAPPSSIGKFGGDTDNWMWPRHTGDFSLFRIYTDKDGKPAKYSAENIPLKPKHFLPISVKGVKKDDFAMIFGFPGSTNRYMTSHGVKIQLEQSNPAVVKIRDKKLQIMKSYMDKDHKTQLQYASKYAQTANYWKYFIGQSKGLVRWDIYNERKSLEDNFQKWADADETRAAKYGKCLSQIDEGYKEYQKYNLAMQYFNEAIFQGPEFPYFSIGAYQLYALLEKQDQESKANKAKFNEMIKNQAAAFETKLEDFFNDSNKQINKDLFVELFGIF